MTCASCGARCHGRYCEDCGRWESRAGEPATGDGLGARLLVGDRVRAAPGNGAAPAEGDVVAVTPAADHDRPVAEPVVAVDVGEETWDMRASNVGRVADDGGPGDA